MIAMNAAAVTASRKCLVICVLPAERGLTCPSTPSRFGGSVWTKRRQTGRGYALQIGNIAALACLAGVSGCSSGGQRAGFCGLARTANGFDPVRAVHGIGCRDALTNVPSIERGAWNGWTCSRAVHAVYELDCRRGREELQVLERTPVAAVRHGAV